MIGQALQNERLFSSSRETAPTPSRTANGLHDLFAAEPSKLLKSGETLFAQGKLKTNAYLVESGSVVICRLRVDGLRQIVKFAVAGDLMGLESGDTHVYEARALAQTRFHALPHVSLLRHVTRDPRLASEMLDALSHDIRESHRHLFMVGGLRAKGRVASFLVSLAQRNAHFGYPVSTVTLPGRRCDMADFLCMSVETVSRALTELKTSNVISLKGGRQIEIHKSDALERLASDHTHS